MTKIEANVPDYLARQTLAVAERERVSIDQIVALALSAQLAAWKGSDDLETRARRANLENFDLVMTKVPNLPAGLPARLNTPICTAEAVLTLSRGAHLMPPPNPVEFRVDHPFLLAIQDQTSGAGRFLGRVNDPQ